MDFLSYEKRLAYLLELIMKGRLRSLDDVAGRFSCSTRTMKRMINHLRDQGNDVRYDRKLKKYYVRERSEGDDH